ncbi:MAG: hypothetical protein ACREO9_09495 [Lysobacterales bacterium]
MMYARLALVLAFAFCALVSCSSNPLKPEPVCGPGIAQVAVMLVDATGYEMHQDKIAEAVRQQAGAYRLMTAKPVWIPKKGVSGNSGEFSNLVGIKSIAADWGCNLLVVLDVKMGKTGFKLESRNEDRIWLVEAGMRVTQ